MSGLLKGTTGALTAASASDITSLVDGTYVNVVGDTMTGALTVQVSDGSAAITTTGTTVGGSISLRPDGTSGNAIRWGGSGAEAGTFRFLGPADAERMRIDVSGNVGIGKTPTVKLDVQGNANFYSGSAGTDLDTLFAAHVTNNAAFTVGYQVSGVDLQTRFDPLANPAIQNAGARIPATSLRTSVSGWSANTDLASIFCGNAGQYSLTTPANGTKTSGGGWTSPKTWTHTLTITFANAAALTNYFFYGGRILIAPSQSAGTVADNTLATMFSNVGSLIIYDAGHYRTGGGGTITNSGTGGSNIGTTPVALYNTTDGSPYTGSTYSVSMVANAAAGSATVLTITTTLAIVTSGTIADTYSGTYTSAIQQRNHPTQTVPTFGGSLV